MKLKRFFSFLLFAAVITVFTACDEDEDTSVPVDVTLNFTAPSDTGRRQGHFHRPQPWERIRARPVPKFRHHTFFGTL